MLRIRNLSSFLLTTLLALVMQSKVSAQTDSAVRTNYDGCLLVDVRTPEEYAEGTVPGAINIPLADIEQRMGEIPKDQPVVVFCRSGNRSSRAQALLRSHDYTNIIDGGSWLEVKKKISR